MQQINTNFQTLQTNHNQYINQWNQLTDDNKNKNTVEYIPNNSNSFDEEIRKAETYFDWLKDNLS